MNTDSRPSAEPLACIPAGKSSVARQPLVDAAPGGREAVTLERVRALSEGRVRIVRAVSPPVCEVPIRRVAPAAAAKAALAAVERDYLGDAISECLRERRPFGYRDVLRLMPGWVCSATVRARMAGRVLDGEAVELPPGDPRRHDINGNDARQAKWVGV